MSILTPEQEQRATEALLQINIGFLKSAIEKEDWLDAEISIRKIIMCKYYYAERYPKDAQ